MNEFGSNVERHRRELLVHCYRMLGSLPDAEDAVQETSLRAWRYRDSLKEGAPLRPWLYRVATNACLDAVARDEGGGGRGLGRRAGRRRLAGSDSGLSARATHPAGEDAGDDHADARNHRNCLSDGNLAPHTAAAGRFDSV